MKPKRRWFQYTLRTFFIAFTVLTIAFATKVYHVKRERNAANAIQAIGGTVRWTYEGPKLLERVASELGLIHVTSVVYGARMKRSPRFKTDLIQYNAKATDSTLAYLLDLPHLQTVDLRYTNITESGLARLEKLGHVKSIDLRAAEFSGNALRSLQAKLPGCQIDHFLLNLRYTGTPRTIER